MQQKVVGRTEVEKMTKEVKCVKCGRKGMNTVFIPISAARGKMCPGCKKRKGRSINAVLMGISKIYKTISFIRNKGDKHKSENCSLQNGSQLCANK